MTDPDDNQPRGYAEALDHYWQAGWRSIIPLAPRTKYPTHSVKCAAAKAKRRDHVKSTCDTCISYTGYDAVIPSYPDMMAWAESDRYRDGNTSLRLPDGFIGIDVDAYGAKKGDETFAECVRRWGPLPRGPRSSSRQGNLTSGIRLFRVPVGTVLETIINFPELGVGDVEIVQPHHRYAVVWPSVHPEGGVYTWRDEADRQVPIPTPESIPELPPAWLDGLKVQPRATLDDNTIRYDVRNALTPGQPSEMVATRLRQAIKELNIPGASRHDTCNRHVMALARLGKSGHAGVEHAMRILCDVLIALRTGDSSNSPEGTRGEFVRMLTNERISLELSQPGLTDWVNALIIEDVEAMKAAPVTPDQQPADTSPAPPASDPTQTSGPPPEGEGPEREATSNTEPSDAVGVPVDDSAPRSDLEYLERGFWESRESLAMVYNTALATMASPWAVLGMAAARALTTVRPHVTLPPLIGGPGSLNWFVALVARSGGGKGAAGAAARMLVPDEQIITKNVGSGEGIIAAFGRPGDDSDSAPTHEALMINVDEVDTLVALNQRSASTTMTVLRSAFSGETLGFSYADKTKRRHIGAHTYRMTLVVSVQPKRAGGLLSDEAGGTPQRFMWFPAADSRISLDERWPSGSLTIPSPGEWLYPREIQVPPDAAQLIRSERVRAMRGDQDALDGHALFCREKFAYALAVLDGRVQMTQEDWELSGIAADVSTYTRQTAVDEVKEAARIEAIDRGEIRGIELHASDEAKELESAERLRRVLRWAIGKISEAGEEGIANRDLQRKANPRDRRWLEGALGIGVSNGLLKQLEGTTQWVML